MDLTERFPKCQSYPPVPNWYSSYITAIVEPHFFLYATKNCIVVLDLNDMRYFNSFLVSNEKVLAIAACQTFCFTAGMDKNIRVWNIMLGTLLFEYHDHDTDVKVLKLIRKNTVLISGSKSGKIVITKPFEKNAAKEIETKVKSEIMSIATTQYQGEDYMAVGYANGMIFVEKIGSDLSMTTVFQIATDNDAIVSLDWQMTPEEGQEVWPLLASSTKRKRHISLWAFPSQSQIMTIKLPNPPAQVTEQQKANVWVELAWSPREMGTLYFSSYIGLIHCVDISKGKPIHCTAQRLERHNRNVFTINWFNNGQNCITTSIDKQVIKWDVQRKICLQNLKTHSGFPYALDSPSWNEGQLAVGMGDNAIKLWNFSSLGLVMKKKKPHDYYESTVFWKGLQGKIEKIRWHPRREGFLAYGNEYGHVGMVDTFNSKHIPFKNYHKVQAAPYIDWGLDMTSSLEDLDMRDTLLSCGGDGIIHVYDAEHPNVPPINLNERLQEKNPDWFISLGAIDSRRCIMKIDATARFIAIGHSNGLVEVYALANLKVVYVSNCQRQSISSLDWKNLDGRFILASGSIDSDIAIHDLGNIDISSLPDVPIPRTDPTALLKGHKRGILDLKWSFHTDKLLLASASEDNFVAVWDANDQKMVALFGKHRGQVLSVCWNRLNYDVIFSGSEDRFIYEWSYLDFPGSGFVESYMCLFDREKRNFTKPSKKRKKDASTTHNDSTSSSPASTFTLNKKHKKAEVESTTKSSGMMLSLESEKAKSKLKKEQYCLVIANNLLDGKVKSVIQQLVADSLTDEQQQDATVIRYTQFWNEVEDRSAHQPENLHELLYGDKNDIQRLIELEVDALNTEKAKLLTEPTCDVKNDISQGFDTKLAMDLMRCEYSMMDKTKVHQNSTFVLTDWIILALSPMVGKQKWIELMLQQAQKLESLQQYHLAASCYIACSHIYKAIDTYRQHGMFREAIALAKLRLPPNDPVVESLFADWAKELQKGEQDTLTATCYLMSKVEGSMGNAINALARSGKESGLFYAACLAVATKETNKDLRVAQWLKKVEDRLLNKKATSNDVTEEHGAKNIHAN